jgi:hypothetical protein
LSADVFEIAAVEQTVDKIARQQVALQGTKRAAGFDELVGAALHRQIAAADQGVQQQDEPETERDGQQERNHERTPLPK